MIYFIRHGQTDDNLNQIYTGQKDVPLNQNGIAQAQSTAEELKDTKIDICFCSPLLRAKQTCEIIVGSLDDVIIDERLVERSFGKYEGLTRKQFDFTNFCKKGFKELNGAESVEDVEKRVHGFLDELKQEEEKNNE